MVLLKIYTKIIVKKRYRLSLLKMKSSIKALSLTLVFSIGFCGCYKDNKSETEIGKTGTAINTGWKKAIIEADVENDILSYFAICYSKDKKEPTIDDNIAYFDINAFATLTGLEETTTYYWRTFMQKDGTVQYDDVVQSFITLKCPDIKISDIDTTKIKANSVALSGTINPLYTGISICYSTSQNTTTSDNTTSVSEVGSENFAGMLTNLTPKTTYYARAYVINSVGETAYGDEVSFETKPPRLPEVKTLEAVEIGNNKANLWGQINDEGDPIYTEKGICWGTSPNLPDLIKNMKPADYSQGNSFYASVQWNGTAIVFYYCAYAISSVGTVYGDVKQFGP